MALADGPNDAALIQDVIRRHVYLALCELSDTTPEPEDEDESELAWRLGLSKQSPTRE